MSRVDPARGRGTPPRVRAATSGPGAFALVVLLALGSAAARAEESRITGRVIDSETLAPIQDAEIELANTTAGQGFYRTRTDRAGTFTIQRIAANRYYGLIVTARGYADFNLASWQFPSEQRAVDVVIPLDRAGALEVRATRADGRTPVRGAKVAIQTERGARWWEGFRPPPVPVFTDSVGVARLEGLEAGSWTVTVESSDLIPFEMRNVALRRGETTVLPAKLARPGSLSGSVRLSDGNPVQGLTVTARGPAEGVGTSDADGAFTIEGLPPGRYRLSVSQEGFEPLRGSEPHALQEGESRGAIELTATPKPPELAITLEREAFAPSMDKLPKFVRLRSFRAGTVDLALFEIPVTRLMDTVRDYRELARRGDLSVLSAVHRWQHTAREGPPFAWREERVELPDSLKPGAYVLQARSGALERRAIFFVTDLGLMVKRSATHALVSAGSISTGVPVSGATITMVQATDRRAVPGTDWNEVVVAPGQANAVTDARGMAEMPIPEGIQRARFVAVSPANGVSVVESPLAPAAELGGDQVYLYTERPIYRPGQTVYWKAFARKGGAAGGYALPDAGRVHLRLTGPEGDELQVASPPLSPSGAADGAVTLPAEVRLGDWNLSVKVGRSSASTNFAVQEYRKPEYRVEVTPDREVYVSGDEVRFVIAANYFFGAPVFGAVVRYNLFESRLRVVDTIEDDEEETGPQTGYGRVLKTGEARTDIDGRVALTLAPPRATYDRRVTLEVEVVDAANRAVSGRGSAIVGRGLFTVEVRPTQALVLAGRPVGVELLTRDHLGKPVTASVTVEIDQDDWNPVERRYVRSSRPLASITLTTDARGRATASLLPSPARAGYLKIRARAVDAKANRITDESSVWVYDASVSRYGYRYPALEAFLDRDRYEVGDTARVLINTDERDAQVTVTMEGRELTEVQVLSLTGNTGLAKLVVRPEHAPNAYVGVHVRRRNEIQSRTLGLAVAAPRRDMVIRLSPDKQEYRPQETARISVDTRDGAGRPVAGELSVGVVDEAIYSLRADATPDPHDVFYGKRPNWVTTAVSFPLLYFGGADKGREENVRKDFRDVALWAPTVRTDAEGHGEVSLIWPDNLTTWRVTGRGMTETTLVGQAVSRALVSKPLVARIVSPRSFVAGDEARLISVVNNRTTEPVLNVRESIEVSGAARAMGKANRTNNLSARGESRSEWTVAIEGRPEADSTSAVFTFRASAKVDADAVRVSTPVRPRAVPLHSNGAGVEEGSGAALTVDLPRDLIQAGSRVRIECAPSPAAMALAASRYLADYPYGCSEQTANAIIAATGLVEAGRKAGRAPPGWEDPAGKLAPYIVRLEANQSPQGGWGWWRDAEPDAYLTALALDALARAARLGVLSGSGTEAMWQGGMRIQPLLDAVRNRDGEAYVVAHLTSIVRLPLAGGRLPGLRGQVDDVADALYAARNELSTTGLALLTRAQAELGHTAEAKALLAMLRSRAISGTDGTHWPPGNSDIDAWFGDEIETTSYALSAMLAVTPEDRSAASVVRWLATRRAGGRWRSTRTTAPVATAFAEYLAARPEEMKSDYRLRAQWNGETVLERSVTQDDVFGAGSFEVTLPGSKLRAGKNTLTITKEGSGVVYFSWNASAMVPSPGPDTSGDKRLSVSREYLHAERTTDRRGRPQYLVSPIPKGKSIRVGESILVRLTLRATRALRWLLVEDPRPASFEVSELLPAGAQWPYGTHAEQRDDRNVFFIDEAPEGETVIEYLLRPEIGGTFTVLPATASAMYVPELEVRSGEARVETSER